MVKADHQTDIRPALVETVTTHGWRLFELRSREMDLEEIFHRIVEREKDTEEEKSKVKSQKSKVKSLSSLF
jgi:hypothetical protein